MTGTFYRLRKVVQALANPVWLFIGLPWLMLLLVLGTVAQRYIGLYASQKLFFGSFVLWMSGAPLPGAYSVLALIAFSLSAKLIVASPLSKNQLGIILSHVSVLVLLIGGLVSTLYREEGYMVLAEGQSTHFVSDYHDREFTVLRNGVPILSLMPAQLHPGDMADAAPLPFKLYISRFCSSCQIVARANFDLDYKAAAKDIDIAEVPLHLDEALNQAAVMFMIKGAGDASGNYLASEALKEPPEIVVGSDHYRFNIAPALRLLPFDIGLVHFKKTDYPGTDMAQRYSSAVSVKEKGVQWNALIEMNAPLRHSGYTFYQSSFVQEDGKLLSVIAVVKNAGAWLPYLAILMLCAGLGLHLVVTLKVRKSA